MTTEVLINDGGAPARIMNLGAANVALEAGLFVDINSSGKIIAMADDQKDGTNQAQAAGLGVLLVDAVAGEPTSIVTGKGIVCNVQSVASLAAGDELVIDGAGKLEKPTNDDTDRVVAIALAATFAGVGTDGVANNFTKVLLI
tara:strand:+ start:1250 stop:1678 length:429 start_codon:yes stop_codon:yes gene_type:complete